MKAFVVGWRKWATVLLGAYLFFAPWNFGASEDKVSSANAWIVGALIFALADTLNLAFDFLSWLHAQKLRYQACGISPEKLVRYGEPEQPVGPEMNLSWSAPDRAVRKATQGPGAENLPWDRVLTVRNVEEESVWHSA